jgi:hypothetical protein
MPNHVTNEIKFYGKQENINKVLKLIEGNNEYIDFNAIVPMPDNIYMGNLGERERIIYGINNWYDWSISNWGTKWNAYSVSFDEDTNIIWFDTAWTSPLPVLEALAKLCYEHQVRFEGKWADEDRGHNVGTFASNCNGDEYWFDYEYVDDCSNEAYEIYVELKGEDMCMGKDENGNWISYDCDTCPNAGEC